MAAAGAGLVAWRCSTLRFPMLVTAVIALAVVRMCPDIVPFAGSGGVRPPAVVFLDVGQGDSVLVLGTEVTILIDGGPDPAVLAEKLRRYRVREVDLIVISHPHADHVRGLEAVVGVMPVGAVLFRVLASVRGVGEVLAVVIADRGGPGEREEGLDTARRHLRRVGVEADQIVRIDVPSSRGAGASPPGGPDQQGTFRAELIGIVPLLQSSSLFGQKQGLLLVDANYLLAAEAQALAELLPAIDPSAVAVALVAQRSLPTALSKKVKEIGKVESIRALWESQIHGWLTEQAKEKGLRIGSQARVALIQRFGTDRASLRRALEQLQGDNRPISAQMIVERFRNRPDQPVFRILDEILAGNTPAALRRLGDYLANARSSDGRPHMLLGALESDLRLRLKASQARDREHFRQMEEDATFSRLLESAPGPLDQKTENKLRTTAKSQVRSSQARHKRIWSQRKAISSVSRQEQIHAAQRALSLVVQADRTLKLFPVALHQPVLERTVAELCGVYQGFAGLRRRSNNPGRTW